MNKYLFPKPRSDRLAAICLFPLLTDYKQYFILCIKYVVILKRPNT